MSRGYWDYKDSILCSDIFGYAEKNKIPNIFGDKKISEIIYDMFHILYEADNYFSGDSGKDDYEKAINKFKKKWKINTKTDIVFTCNKCKKKFKDIYDYHEHMDTEELA